MSKTKAIPMVLNGKNRYVIIDVETGEILEDAQGYGFTSPVKAHAAWGYKNQNQKSKEKLIQKEENIKAWLDRNPDFIGWLKDINELNAEEGIPKSEQTVRSVLNNLDRSIPDEQFTIRDLYNYIRRGPIHSKKNNTKQQ